MVNSGDSCVKMFWYFPFYYLARQHLILFVFFKDDSKSQNSQLALYCFFLFCETLDRIISLHSNSTCIKNEHTTNTVPLK